MKKRFSARLRSIFFVSGLSFALFTAGCATTPQYTIRPTPVPVETQEARQIELEISRVQAQEFEQQGARELRFGERPGGMDVVGISKRLAQVTERPYLNYRVLLYNSEDPNAAALADGRIYISTGMIDFLKKLGSDENELAFIVGHELAHTVAQHLVQRYEQMQKQALLLAAVQASASALTKNPEAVQTVNTIAGLLQQVALSGYSQQQELEADQLGVRYVMQAGYDPHAALRLFEAFAQFDTPGALLRTHPYSTTRREYVERYLVELEAQKAAAPSASAASFTSRTSASAPTLFGPAQRVMHAPEDAAQLRIKSLRDAQKLYPLDSVSWKNLQKQIDDLERQR